MHLDDGQLRSYLDDALPAAERAASTDHISQCGSCHRRADELAAGGARVNAQLTTLTRVDASTQAQVALQRFYARYDGQKEDSVLNRIFGKPLRPVWALVVVVALVAVSMTFAPVRAWAGQFLGMFRVQTVEVLPVDPTLLDQLTGNSAL
jgi:anti-sigma factor RsiW